MSDQSLPAPFVDLERFVAKWDRPDISSRYAQRLASTIEELEDFHDALLPRILEIRAFLDAKDFAEYDDADRRLARITFAWCSVAEAVEVFKQPRVPDSTIYWETVAEPVL